MDMALDIPGKASDESYVGAASQRAQTSMVATCCEKTQIAVQ